MILFPEVQSAGTKKMKFFLKGGKRGKKFVLLHIRIVNKYMGLAVCIITN